MPRRDTIKDRQALQHLMDLLAIEGLSGDEGRVARAVRERLIRAGAKRAWIKSDRAHDRIPGDYKIGNLILKLPGTEPGPRRLLMGHMDTVPLCRGAKPVRRGRRIVPGTRTALGGDNRTSVGCILTVIETILRESLPHPPITVLFTVAEEVGLWGARLVKVSDLGRPKLGINIDSGDPYKIITGATGADRWEVEVIGRSAHAGVHPENGVSASLIACRAISDAAQRGYFGKIVKRKKRGTANVGVLRGGEATNQVTDHVYVRGESRSHDPDFVAEITSAYEKAFQRAARSVKNRQGLRGRVKFKRRTDYSAFRLDHNSPVVRFARKVAKDLGAEPQTMPVNGGLDANYLNAKGVPTITVGAGQHNPHTLDEYVNIDEYLDGCRFVLELVTRELVV